VPAAAGDGGTRGGGMRDTWPRDYARPRDDARPRDAGHVATG